MQNDENTLHVYFVLSDADMFCFPLYCSLNNSGSIQITKTALNPYKSLADRMAETSAP